MISDEALYRQYVSGDETGLDELMKRYHFDGWYYDNSGTKTKWDFDTDKVGYAMTFTAKWENTYTVTLEANGGTIASGKDVTSYTYGKGATLPTENDITREGYTFKGWYVDSDFSGSPVTAISDTDINNKTFYAKWTRNTTPITHGDTVRYIVEHYKTSGNGYTLEETEYPAGKIGDTATATPKTYDGFTYNASISTASGTLKKISGSDDILTLKLYYDLTVYTVTVNDSYATASGAGSYASGDAVTISAGTRSGYTFSGWTSDDGVNLADASSATTTFTMPVKAVSVTANWKSTGGGNSSGGEGSGTTYYKLTFETNGGCSIKAISTTYGKTSDLSGYTPTHDGYDFSGWYSDAALTNKITEIKLNGNKTVYAGWTKHNPNTGANPFTDVSTSDWFYDDVMFVYENGLMAGTSATTFEPYSNATRVQIAVIFYCLDGSPAVERKNDFTDVEYGPGTVRYYNAVTWAQQNGIMSGCGGGKFGPNDPVTCEQLASIFYCYAKYKGCDVTVAGSLDRFTDKSDLSAWAQEAMKWAVGNGILNGRENNLLDPKGTATRAEIAAMLHRFVEKYGRKPVVTPTGTTGWTKPND